MSTWLLIFYVSVHGGIVPVMQDFTSKEQCEFVEEHLVEAKVDDIFSRHAVQLRNIECVELPK